ncbi:hypothetical protein F0L74_20715 [Chitinophaga agrisoli]|uniref:DUF5723 domain-containing protein n=1 Tax=Chitinophaga agrisoli TaxID=2607653 RepID=A0A5B2VK78_9BACT|nr:STN domain-containing protein [Chitinophaga agrisoli]KAA2238647.1 hypothetical protein F0L74_20715 [Chitinophaga agrisoli]
MRLLLTGLLISCTTLSLQAQGLLSNPVTISVRQEPLCVVLNKIASQEHFSFSYNAAILPQDSLVSLSVQEQPLRQVLDRLFAGRYDYLEEGRYLILRPATHNLYGALPPMQVRNLEPITIWEKKLLARKGRKASFRPFGGVTYGTSYGALGGLFNIHRGDGRNLQLAGVVNINEGNFKGVQAAGVHNRVVDTLKGVQVSSVLNEGSGVVRGGQLALVNRARKLKGWQIGLVNIADSSSGYSLGILNLVRDGYHQIVASTNDLLNTNMGVKLGNAHLYSIISAGVDISKHQKAFAVGFGLGHDVVLGKAVSIGVQAQYNLIKRLTWDNRLLQLKSLVNVRAGKHLLLFGGPVFNRYINNDPPWDGYKDIVTPEAYAAAYARYEHATRNWVGWEIGIATPSLLTPQAGQQQQSRKGWWLSAGPLVNVNFRGDWNPGLEAYLEKGWEGNISLLLITGWMQLMNRRVTTSPSPYIPYYNIIETEDAFSFFPLMAGIRILTGRYFYVGAAAGPGIKMGGLQPGLRFTGAPLLGFQAGHWDLGARMEYIGQIGWTPMLRLTYGGIVKES